MATIHPLHLQAPELHNHVVLPDRLNRSGPPDPPQKLYDSLWSQTRVHSQEKCCGHQTGSAKSSIAVDEQTASRGYYGADIGNSRQKVLEGGNTAILGYLQK